MYGNKARWNWYHYSLMGACWMIRKNLNAIERSPTTTLEVMNLCTQAHRIVTAILEGLQVRKNEDGSLTNLEDKNEK